MMLYRLKRQSSLRPGFTYMELQIAFAALAIMMAGLCPLVISQQRLMQRMERRVYCLMPQDGPLPDTDPYGVTTISAGAFSDESQYWNRRFDFVSVGHRLITVDVNNARYFDRKLSLLSQNATWMLELDSSLSREPIWKVMEIPVQPAPLAELYPTRFLTLTRSYEQGKLLAHVRVLP